jgi:hypothetical protein
MTYNLDEHIQALRNALVAEHEAHIVDVQARADGAAARGDDWHRKFHQDQVEELRAMTYPWDVARQAA